MASSSAMPSTPFIGVRISWLMLARNSDFALSAVSARTTRRRSSSSRSFSRLMSEKTNARPGHARSGAPRAASHLPLSFFSVIEVLLVAQQRIAEVRPLRDALVAGKSRRFRDRGNRPPCASTEAPGWRRSLGMSHHRQQCLVGEFHAVLVDDEQPLAHRRHGVLDEAPDLLQGAARLQHLPLVLAPLGDVDIGQQAASARISAGRIRSASRPFDVADLAASESRRPRPAQARCLMVGVADVGLRRSIVSPWSVLELQQRAERCGRAAVAARRPSRLSKALLTSSIVESSSTTTMPTCSEAATTLSRSDSDLFRLPARLDQLLPRAASASDVSVIEPIRYLWLSARDHPVAARNRRDDLAACDGRTRFPSPPVRRRPERAGSGRWNASSLRSGNSSRAWSCR